MSWYANNSATSLTILVQQILKDREMYNKEVSDEAFVSFYKYRVSRKDLRQFLSHKNNM